MTINTKPADESSTCISNIPTKHQTQSRLLYRGSLSLPDSHLLLDGLTFTIELPADDPNAGRTLLESPLPLALESMRGRPSLRLVGIVKMDEVHCEFTERVSLHIHPRCVLTRQLFEYTLCAEPVSPSKGHTDSGIRINLGDASNANASNDIIVYGRPHPSSSVMQLCVSRILPLLPKSALPRHVLEEEAQHSRRPRPDDPTPRRPPAEYGGIVNVGLLKRTASMKLKKDEEDTNEGENSMNLNKRLLKKVNEPTGLKSSQGSFKVPGIPPGKAHSSFAADIFDAPVDIDVASRPSDQETKNKMFIKKVVVRLMSAAGISKTNASYKEFFNVVYHGTSFALRAKMTSSSVESDCGLVDRIAQAHITLYLGGSGVGINLLQQQG